MLLKNVNDQILVGQELSNDLRNIFATAQGKGEVNTFYNLFWEEQIRMQGQSPNGIRYHPELIKFCLSLASKSPACYEELRDSGLLRLPSSRTLRDYRNVYRNKCGLQEHVLEEMKTKAESLAPHERFLVLSVDEMKVKQGIVYSAADDEMMGFIDLGEGRNGEENKVATHALQFYIRSITTNFSRPLVFYSTNVVSSDDLTSMFWEIVAELSNINFDVLALVADGATNNRQMFTYLNNLHLEVPYKCANIYKPDMPIFPISDPPHLLKTTCNAIRSSKPGGTRMLKYEKDFILWEHFCKIPYLFNSNELSCCKLTDAHFSTKSFVKMRVCYAAQLLSESSSKIMRARGGPAMRRSAWFAALMNRWFDLMNTRINYKYKPDLKPYTSVDDPRLVWLEETFLKELKMWKDSIIHGTAKEKAKQFLTSQTYLGLCMSTKAMVGMVKFVLCHSPPETYVLTKRVSQDALEAYFGHMRQIGRCCENPSIKQYAEHENIIMAKKNIKASKGFNVNHVVDWAHSSISNKPMKRRKVEKKNY